VQHEKNVKFMSRWSVLRLKFPRNGISIVLYISLAWISSVKDASVSINNEQNWIENSHGIFLGEKEVCWSD
jgi:hypothetical protein